MAAKIKVRATGSIIWLIGLSLFLIESGGCNKAPARIFTIGIVSSTAAGNKAYEGFQNGMAESGYIEGKNIRYIFKGIIEQDEKNVDAGIRELLAQDIDILLAFGRNGAMRAKELVKGTDTSIIFCGDAWPVEDGLVESINRPGGNITGVRPANSIAKALEWQIMIVPDAKKLWVPYNPDDGVSVAELSNLEEAASQLGVELILHKVHSVEEAVAAIENLPEDIKAIFRIPSFTLDQKNTGLSQAAIKRCIPMGASIQLDEAVLITLTNDFFNAGEKAAWLAQQIHHGIKPADLPVETAEVSLIINLKTAEAIGIKIPDNILAQASSVIR